MNPPAVIRIRRPSDPNIPPHVMERITKILDHIETYYLDHRVEDQLYGDPYVLSYKVQPDWHDPFLMEEDDDPPIVDFAILYKERPYIQLLGEYSNGPSVENGGLARGEAFYLRISTETFRYVVPEGRLPIVKAYVEKFFPEVRVNYKPMP